MQNEGEYGSGGFPKENGGVQPPRQSRNLPKANTFAEAKISIIVKTPRPVGRGVSILQFSFCFKYVYAVVAVDDSYN